MAGFTTNYDGKVKGVDYNDLYLDNKGNLAIVYDADTETVENCYHALELIVGEYNFNTKLGIDWLTYLSSDNVNTQDVIRAIYKALLRVKRVTKVQVISLTNDKNGKLIYNIQITLNNSLTYGVTNV